MDYLRLNHKDPVRPSTYKYRPFSLYPVGLYFVLSSVSSAHQSVQDQLFKILVEVLTFFSQYSVSSEGYILNTYILICALHSYTLEW